MFNFTTAPLPHASGKVKFLVYGDMGRSLDPGAHETAKQALKEVKDGSQLVLHIGDISYARGFVSVSMHSWAFRAPLPDIGKLRQVISHW